MFPGLAGIHEETEQVVDVVLPAGWKFGPDPFKNIGIEGERLTLTRG